VPLAVPVLDDESDGDGGVATTPLLLLLVDALVVLVVVIEFIDRMDLREKYADAIVLVL